MAKSPLGRGSPVAPISSAISGSMKDSIITSFTSMASQDSFIALGGVLLEVLVLLVVGLDVPVHSCRGGRWWRSRNRASRISRALISSKASVSISFASRSIDSWSGCYRLVGRQGFGHGTACSGRGAGGKHQLSSSRWTRVRIAAPHGQSSHARPWRTRRRSRLRVVGDHGRRLGIHVVGLGLDHLLLVRICSAHIANNRRSSEALALRWTSSWAHFRYPTGTSRYRYPAYRPKFTICSLLSWVESRIMRMMRPRFVLCMEFLVA